MDVLILLPECIQVVVADDLFEELLKLPLHVFELLRLHAHRFDLLLELNLVLNRLVVYVAVVVPQIGHI